MSKTVKVPTTRAASIWEVYPLYEALYGRGFEQHALSNRKTIFAIEALAKVYPALAKRGFGLLEAFAGRNEHRAGFMAASQHLPITAYESLDSNPQMASFGIDHIARIEDFKLPAHINFVIAHFYSLAVITDKRSDLVAMFKQVSEGLRANGGGGFFFHLNPDGQRRAFKDLSEGGREVYYELGSTHALRAEHKIPVSQDASVRANIQVVYDRWQGSVAHTIKRATVYVGENPIHAYTVDAPLVLRYWSEAEISDALAEGGFDTAQYHGIYFENFYRSLATLDRKVDDDDIDWDSSDPYFDIQATDITAIVTPQRKRLTG